VGFASSVGRTVVDVLATALIAYRGPFDGFHALPASVSKALLVRFDYNKCSVHAQAAGRPVEIHAYADRIVIRQSGEIVAEHVRRFGREQTIYDPWHYVPVLAKKPGALRNGAPFKDWALPPAIERVRRRLGSQPPPMRLWIAHVGVRAGPSYGLPGQPESHIQGVNFERR
jgi:hypothetical protein